MKKLFLIVIICATGFDALPQYLSENKGPVLPSTKILLDKAQFFVGNYKMAVILSSNCKNTNYDEQSILQMFTDSAKIEVSVNKRGEKARIVARSPKEYFSRLQKLCRGINYDSIYIQFLPDILENDDISRFENTCVIKRDIEQKFVAFKRNQRNPVYCDLTIKSITIIFSLNRDGSYKALISYVKVESTRDCDIKETIQ